MILVNAHVMLAIQAKIAVNVNVTVKKKNIITQMAKKDHVAGKVIVPIHKNYSGQMQVAYQSRIV